MPEHYFGPVGFAKEPIEVRRRWLTRIFTFALLIFIVWLFLTKVVQPPDDDPGITPNVVEETLPAPK